MGTNLKDEFDYFQEAFNEITKEFKESNDKDKYAYALGRLRYACEYYISNVKQILK